MEDASNISNAPTGKKSFVTPRRLGVAVAALAAVVALATVQQAVGRVPSPASASAYGTDEQEAAKVLGRPVPQPHDVPSGLSRSQFTLEIASPDPRLTNPRKVRQNYALDGKNVALLTVFRARLGQSLDNLTDVRLGGTTVGVTTKTLTDGTTLVSYRWQLGDLAAYMDIILSNGITRDVADRIVASVR